MWQRLRHANGFLVAALCLVPALAWAKHRPEPTAHGQVALFPLLTVEGVGPIISAANEVIERAKSEAPEASVLAGSALDARLGVSAAAALATCGDNVLCVIALGKRLHTRNVIIGRARPEGSGIRIIFVNFEVANASIAQKTSIDIGNADDAAFILGGSLYALLGVTQSGYVEISGIANDTQVLVDGQIVGNGPKKYALAPGRRSVSLGDVTSVVSIAPGKTLTMHKKSASEASSEPSSSGHVEVPMLVGFSDAPGLTAPSRMERNPYLNYSGIGLAAAGVATIAIGGVLGVLALNQSSQANQSSTPQVPAVRAENSARGDAFGANVCYVVGGVAILAGAILFGSSWAFAPHAVATGASE